MNFYLLIAHSFVCLSQQLFGCAASKMSRVNKTSITSESTIATAYDFSTSAITGAANFYRTEKGKHLCLACAVINSAPPRATPCSQGRTVLAWLIS